MKKTFIGILEVCCSGLFGVILTLGCQYLFPTTQPIVVDGEERNLTETELQGLLESTLSELSNKKKELSSTKSELNSLKNANQDSPSIKYSDVDVNIKGQSLENYVNGYLSIDGKDYIMLSILDKITNEEITQKDNVLYIGHSSSETTNLMKECPPYDITAPTLYKTDPFKMSGKQYANGFTMLSPDKDYALINLDAKFSKLEFDFGHVDGSGDYSGTVNIYLDGDLKQTLEKNADDQVTHETVELNYAKNLKIEINTGAPGWFGEYGFGNMILTY